MGSDDQELHTMVWFNRVLEPWKASRPGQSGKYKTCRRKVCVVYAPVDVKLPTIPGPVSSAISVPRARTKRGSRPHHAQSTALLDLPSVPRIKRGGRAKSDEPESTFPPLDTESNRPPPSSNDCYPDRNKIGSLTGVHTKSKLKIENSILLWFEIW